MSVEQELNASVAYTPLQRMRHSAAHVMAEAVQDLFPSARFAIGPAIEDGFYYDMELPRALTPDDFPAIEERMRQSIAARHPFLHAMWPREQALAYFRERDQPYKIEIIENLPDAEVGIYQQGPFLDLCRGPHVENTGQIGPVKLMRVAGAYWRGDEKRQMLQRLYGTAWFTQEDLDHYLWQLEEAKKRDHRKIGRELNLFTFSEDVGPGIPLFLPKGEIIRHEMEQYVRETQEKHGYQHVWTANIARVRLYKKSKHWYHYRDSMFPKMQEERDAHEGESVEELENNSFELKPMNCPSHFLLYKSQIHSYRELPIRYAEFATLYRYEKQGELSGLTRVRSLTQDDSHIFVRHDQVLSEFSNLVKLVREILGTYGLTDYSMRLSLPDLSDHEKYHGDAAIWEQAVKDLRSALDSEGLDYEAAEGEAAFYGPKMDLMARDALGREWQLSTIQLDFFHPENFDLEYIGEDGQPHRPAIIHRAIMGSTERFLGVLIEHYAGNFPVWLAPVQAVVIPISDEKHGEYAQQVLAALQAAGLRAEVDMRKERMNAKVRDAQLQKVPYMLVVGDKEAESGAVSLRLRTNENIGAVPLAEFIALASAYRRERSQELWPAQVSVS
ncbi:MAG: Threonyl-tRNA synthetase [Ktedonobacterales bacterium]|nr:MAG: Threonyl-tRNA synthetase [Ktedonobacterales bacterium]